MVEISANDIPEITRIKIVDLRPGDTVVMLYDGKIAHETQMRLKESVKSLFPDNKCIVLEGGLSIEVLRNTE